MHPTLADAILEVQANAQTGRSLGILVFSGLKELLFMNTTANDLIRNLARTTNGGPVHTGIPIPVIDLCEDLAQLLRERTTAKDWEQVEVKRLLDRAKPTVLLRGYGFPHHSDLSQGCFLILMETIQTARQSPTKPVNAATRLQELYKITEREQMVLVHLLQGMTNKEIAAKLCVSDNAVKDILKRLMYKTKTCTRTGLLAQVLLTASESLKHEPSQK